MGDFVQSRGERVHSTKLWRKGVTSNEELLRVNLQQQHFTGALQLPSYSVSLSAKPCGTTNPQPWEHGTSWSRATMHHHKPPRGRASLKKTKQELRTCVLVATCKIWQVCKLISITYHLGEVSTLLHISLLIRGGKKRRGALQEKWQFIQAPGVTFIWKAHQIFASIKSKPSPWSGLVALIH